MEMGAEYTLLTRSKRIARSRTSRYGRLRKKKIWKEDDEQVLAQRPEYLRKLALKRRRVLRARRAQRQAAVSDADATGLGGDLEPGTLRSDRHDDSKPLSGLPASELHGIMAAGDAARKILKTQGWITNWDATAMKTAVWTKKIVLLPRTVSVSESICGFKLPSINPLVAQAKITSSLFLAEGENPSKEGRSPSLRRETELTYKRPLLLHCVNSALPEKFRAGAKVFMSEGKGGRTLVAYISSVEDADYKVEPYRSYGNDWQSWMYNSKTVIACFNV